MFEVVNRVAALDGGSKFREIGVGIGQRVVGVGHEVDARHDALLVFERKERDDGLGDAGAVQWRRIADPGVHANGLLRLPLVDVYDGVAFEHGEVDRVLYLMAELGEERRRHRAEVDVLQCGVGEADDATTEAEHIVAVSDHHLFSLEYLKGSQGCAAVGPHERRDLFDRRWLLAD